MKRERSRYLTALTAGLIASVLATTPAFAGGSTRIASLPFTDTTSVTFSERTKVTEPAQCRSTFGAEVYKFQPETDMVVTADTIGSNYDTVLSVGYYTGKGHAKAWTEVACDDDSGGFAGASVLTASLTGGTTYYFVAAHYGDPSSDPDRSLTVSVSALP